LAYIAAKLSLGIRLSDLVRGLSLISLISILADLDLVGKMDFMLKQILSKASLVWKNLQS